VERVLLNALGIVARRDQRAVGTHSNITLFNTGRLGVLVAVGFHFVDDDPPLSLRVDRSEWLDVGGCAGAKVSLFFQLVQVVDGIGRIGHNVFVESLNGLVMLIKSVLNVVKRVLRVLQAPRLSGVLGAAWDVFVLGRIGRIGLRRCVRRLGRLAGQSNSHHHQRNLFRNLH